MQFLPQSQLDFSWNLIRELESLPERAKEKKTQSASEKVLGSQPPTAIKVCSRWIKNLNVKGSILEENIR